MIDVSETITVERSPETVFEYLDDPHHHQEITPSLTAVDNIERLDNGGKQLTYTYTIAGVDLDGKLVQTVHDPPHALTFDMDGQLTGELSFQLVAVDEGTEVTYAASYDLPGSIIETIAKPFVRRYNERELRSTLQNLKTRLETSEDL